MQQGPVRRQPVKIVKAASGLPRALLLVRKTAVRVITARAVCGRLAAKAHSQRRQTLQALQLVKLAREAHTTLQ